MNKSTMIAAIFAASTLAASAADVYSSNIVGYSKLTIHPGLNMIGAGFQVVGGTGGQDIQNIFVDEDGANIGGENSFNADNIITWDPTEGAAGAYTYYYKYDSNGTYPEYDNIWYFANDNEITEPIDLSTGFWYNSLSTTSIVMTVAGEVPASNTVSVTIHPGLNMIAFPFTAGFAINTAVDWVVSGAYGGENSFNADNIITWDPTQGAAGAYTYYYYYDSNGTYPEYDNIWYFANDNEITAPLPVSQGFWYLHRGTGFTLTFEKPY